jgi:hypothetical protein
VNEPGVDEADEETDVALELWMMEVNPAPTSLETIRFAKFSRGAP